MLPNGQGGFEGTIGPFGPGTEVWFVVAASTSDQGPLLSNYTSFQVGDVYRNESAGLRVTNVSRSIQDPQPFDTVTVRADILGGLNLSQANVLTLEATRGIAFGFFNPMRRGGNNSYYEGEVFPPSLGGETIVAYFVAVQDVSQNTAVSSLFTYRVASSAVP